jgi:hypothetical protein
MYRSFALSKEHYAHQWRIPADGHLYDRKRVNQLAIEYATARDGPKKQALFLRLVECFHGYLIKYTNMVISGRLPSQKSAAGKDAVQFLKTLLPKGRPVTSMTLLSVCRTLHLAFKQMTTDDVYDVMALCFLRTVCRYDPFYADKVRKVCEVINGRFSKQSQFTAEAVARAAGFDALGCLRLLVRKQYLASVHGAKKKVVGYTRGTHWPAPKSFFEAGPIGFTYFAQMWFRYYLNDYITQVMAELETQDCVLQLDYRVVGAGDCATGDRLQPAADGAFTDHDGIRWAADTTLMDSQLDISDMTDAWVRATDDRLFRNMEPEERKILQMVFRDDQNWVEIAVVLNCTPQWAKERFDEIMLYLQNRFGAVERPPLDEPEDLDLDEESEEVAC